MTLTEVFTSASTQRDRETINSSSSKKETTKSRTHCSNTDKQIFHNQTHHRSKVDNNNNNPFDSLFSSFSLFSIQPSNKDAVPRTVSIPTDEKYIPFENEYISKPKTRPIVDVQLDQTKPKTTVKSNINDELPIFMTFTNNGHCSLNSNISNDSSNSSKSVISIISKTDPTKISKTMVQFIYGPATTQIGLKSLPLNLPQILKEHEPISSDNTPSNNNNKKNNNGFYSIRLTPFLESINTKSILFSPMIRTVGPNSQLVVCRDTKYVQQMILNVKSQYHPISFHSNAISRIHGYLKVDQYGNWYIQDFQSASGTFLNHNRLSKSSTISNDFLLKNGDVIQLGVNPVDDDEIKSDISKCVRFKVELNDSWKLDKVQMKQVVTQRLNNLVDPNKKETCSICLYPCNPCQSIFLASCAHCWHFNCIKPLMFKNYPHFVCPNCRAIIDLEDDGSDEEDKDI